MLLVGSGGYCFILWVRTPSKATSQEILHGVSIGDIRPQATLCGVYLENITGTEFGTKEYHSH